jgi:hypothetical protein
MLALPRFCFHELRAGWALFQHSGLNGAGLNDLLLLPRHEQNQAAK